MKITPAQLKRLQVLYGQFARKSLDAGDGRDARLSWASEQTGRTITSFSDLESIEAKRMIDGLQQLLNVKAPNQSPEPSREQRRQQGTAGRHDGAPNLTTLAGPRDLAMLDRDRVALGWDEARLEAFMRGKKSPTKGRTTLLTLTDINMTHWALQRFIRAAKKATQP